MHDRHLKIQIETQIPHGDRTPEGSKRGKWCPGMWVVEYDQRGLVATCNECGMVRNLSQYLDAEPEEEG